ncbi:MAG TPA: HAD family hydrolase [Methanospirillum sp.]|nr:HAD family hydrolase [Methanospirillum sp.]
MRKAIFLDRDGVINELVLNHATGEYEPPHNPRDLALCSKVLITLKTFQNAGFELFLVSNQPDYAKGKTTLENLQVVHAKLDEIFLADGITFRQYYYCYHHPKGVVTSHAIQCRCRKPSPYFLLKAAQEYDIDLNLSWMIGDRDSDIACGKAAGSKTIMIENPDSSFYRGVSHPDYSVGHINAIIPLILQNNIDQSLT